MCLRKDLILAWIPFASCCSHFLSLCFPLTCQFTILSVFFIRRWLQLLASSNLPCDEIICDHFSFTSSQDFSRWHTLMRCRKFSSTCKSLLFRAAPFLFPLCNLSHFYVSVSVPFETGCNCCECLAFVKPVGILNINSGTATVSWRCRTRSCTLMKTKWRASAASLSNRSVKQYWWSQM